ncbi:hypothetical protein [Pseudoalteromonas phage KB12-38]|nr:hypothetical protein [Pseudoalteromonas phage KB12-38]
MYSVIRHTGIRMEDANATFYLNSTVTGQEHVGCPVSLDPSANFTVGLSQDGEDILGALESFENRSQEGYNAGAVAPKLYTNFTYTGVAPEIGKWVVGAGNGEVKASATAGRALVEAVDTDTKEVSVLFV